MQSLRTLSATPFVELDDSELDQVGGGIVPVILAVPFAAAVVGAGIRAGVAAYKARQALNDD